MNMNQNDVRHLTPNDLRQIEHLAAEARALSSNGAIIQTQEGRHILNLLIRIAEAASGAGVTTKPISTHHA